MKERYQQAVEALLRDALHEDRCPAAALAVGVGDEVYASACAGDYPTPGGTPVDEHTRWDMASMSKIMGTTIVALQALEEGRIRLTDTLCDYFPDVPEDKRGVTIFMLMTHTSGFHPSYRLDLELSSPDQIIDSILHHPLEEKPGVRPIYSCMGFITLAKILEKVCGRPLMALVQERVFDVLGMDETCYCPAPGTPCCATEIDPATGLPLIGVVHDENARFQGGNSGNAGVFSSLRDCITYAKCMARHGAPLIGREMFDSAIVNLTPGWGTCRGLGFQVTGNPDCVLGAKLPFCFGHSGFTGTSLLVEPETGFWVVLLANRVYPTRDNPRFGSFRIRVDEELWALYDSHR